MSMFTLHSVSVGRISYTELSLMIDATVLFHFPLVMPPPLPSVSALTEFPVFENPTVSANFCESR